MMKKEKGFYISLLSGIVCIAVIGAICMNMFGKSEDTEETDYELKSIEDEMDKALKKFNDLCWIMIDKSTETFEIMPSLNRLLNMFENYIINTPISNE